MSASEISLAHPLLPQRVGFLSGQEVPLKWYSLMIGRPVIWAMTSGSVWAQSLVTKVEDPTAFMEAFKKVSACAEIPMTCTSGRASLIRRGGSKPPTRGHFTDIIHICA